MKHYLITSVPAMSARWKKAFPEGQCIGINDINHDPHSIIWVDLSTHSATDKDQLIRQVKNSCHAIIALSSSPNKQEAMAAVCLGCKGYGHLIATPKQFQQMTAVVSNGGYWLGEELITTVIEESNSIEPASTLDDGRNRLTGRELDVADEIAKGASNREIAQRLSISERTVKAHLSVIFDKLQLRDRVQLALKLNRVSI